MVIGNGNVMVMTDGDAVMVNGAVAKRYFGVLATCGFV